MIQLLHAAFVYQSPDGEVEALRDVSFDVQEGEFCSIVGPSGCGKSTLLSALAGLEPLTGGRVELKGEPVCGPSRKVGFMPQRDQLFEWRSIWSNVTLGLTVRGENTPQRQAHVRELLERYGLADFAQKRPSQLSGGEKTRVNLGRLILEDTDILLLDEPTNHLDLQATEWLEEYIRTFRGTVVTISHDRYFLDRTVTRIIEVLDGKAEFYSGNYSFYAVEKERRYQERLKQYLKEQAKIQQLEKAAEQMHLWAFMGNDALHKRAFSMEKRIQRMRTTEKPTKAKKMDARFASRQFKGDEVLQVKGVSKAFDGRTLFSDTYLRVENGERIALIGENGTGKTTLLNMLLGLEPTDSGIFKLGPSVKAAYLPQIIHFDHPERSILDTMLYEKKDMTAQSARNRLAAYQFQGEDVFKPVSVLSGGELSRLRLCMLMDEEINLLILDEPTNHLDIAAREWIEEAVEAFDGTLLFVSHDRYFIQRFATRIWELADGTITDYPMGFAQYRAVKAQEKAPQPVKAPEKKGDTRPPRGNRSHQAARRQLTICETGISKLEAECRRLDEEMAAHACDAGELNRLYQEKQEVEARLEQEMTRWEELSLQIEE